MSQRRYRRSGSPVGGGSYHMAAPMRSSTGMLEYPYHDRYYPPSRVHPEVRTSPRGSADRFPDPQLPPPGAYQGGRSLSLRYPVSYPRPRRATLESDQRRRPVIVPSSQVAASPTGALVRTGDLDTEGDYYVYPSTSARRPPPAHFGVDAAEADRLGPYSTRSDHERERERRPEGAGYPRERRKIYHYGGTVLSPTEDDRARHDPDPYRRSQQRRSLAPDDPLYAQAAPRRRRADSLDVDNRRRPFDMSELRQGLPPLDHHHHHRVRADREPERVSTLPPGVPGPAMATYDSPIERGDAGLAREGSLRSRRKPPVLHQDGGDVRARHGVHPDAAYDYERSPRPRDYVDERERTVPVPAAAAAAAAGQYRSSRGRDQSPDYADDDYDEYPPGSGRHDQPHRHHRHDKHHHHHHHGRSDDRYREDRDFEAGRGRGGADYDPPERHGRDRPDRDHDVLARPPPEELRPRGQTDRDARPREEDVRGRRDTPPQEARDRDVLDREVPGREVRGAVPGPRDVDPRDFPKDRAHEYQGPVGDILPRPNDDHERGRAPRAADSDDGRPSERSDRTDDRASQVRVVSPPRSKDVKPPLKGILREPREKFPEDPAPVREGVAPLKDALKDARKGIPPGARWTKIDRRRVNPAALEEAQERFEERPDHVIVLRVLTREEIEALALRTQQIRDARERRERRSRRSKDKDKDKDREKAREKRRHEADRRDVDTTSGASADETEDSDRDIVFEREGAPSKPAKE